MKRFWILLFLWAPLALAGESEICNGGNSDCGDGSGGAADSTVSTFAEFDACMDAGFTGTTLGGAFRCKFEPSLNLATLGEHTYTVPVGAADKLQVYMDFRSVRIMNTSDANNRSTLVIDVGNMGSNTTFYREGGHFDQDHATNTGWMPIEFTDYAFGIGISYFITGGYDGFNSTSNVKSICGINRGNGSGSFLFVKFQNYRPKCDIIIDEDDDGDIGSFFSDASHLVSILPNTHAAEIRANTSVSIDGGLIQSFGSFRFTAPIIYFDSVWVDSPGEIGDQYWFGVGTTIGAPSNCEFKVMGPGRRTVDTLFFIVDVGNCYGEFNTGGDVIEALTVGPFFDASGTGEITGDACFIVNGPTCTLAATWASTDAKDATSAGGGLYLQACGQTVSHVGGDPGTTGTDVCPSR